VAISIWRPGTGEDAGPRAKPTPRTWTFNWSFTVIGLVLVATLGWWVTHSRIFAARDLSISGNRHLTQQDVLRVGGLDSRSNVLWLSPGQVEGRLERDPWVRSAHVSRTLPSTLRIRITERTPAAVVVPGHFLVATDGTILGVVGSHADYPLIYAPRQTLAVGGRISPSTPGLVVVAALPAAVRGQVEQVDTDFDAGLVLRLRDGATAVYGDQTAAPAKGQALAAVLDWAVRNQVRPRSVDVRAPGQPALVPLTAGGQTATVGG
jgi:cell division protein FtsQ